MGNPAEERMFFFARRALPSALGLAGRSPSGASPRPRQNARLPLDPQRLPFADRRAFRREPTGAGGDPPALAVAVEPHQMIGCAVARVAGGGGGGGRADNRNRSTDRARGARGERADGLL